MPSSRSSDLHSPAHWFSEKPRHTLSLLLCRGGDNQASRVGWGGVGSAAIGEQGDIHNHRHCHRLHSSVFASQEALHDTAQSCATTRMPPSKHTALQLGHQAAPLGSGTAHRSHARTHLLRALPLCVAAQAALVVVLDVQAHQPGAHRHILVCVAVQDGLVLRWETGKGAGSRVSNSRAAWTGRQATAGTAPAGRSSGAVQHRVAGGWLGQGRKGRAGMEGSWCRGGMHAGMGVI